MSEIQAEDLAPTPVSAAVLCLTASGEPQTWETVLPSGLLPDHTHVTSGGQGGQLPGPTSIAAAGLTGSGTKLVTNQSPEIDLALLTTPLVDEILDTEGETALRFAPTGFSGPPHLTLTSGGPGTDVHITVDGSSPTGVNFDLDGLGSLKQDGDIVATLTAPQTLAAKTLTTPTIADFTNATHNHTSNATGGVLGTAALGSGTALSVLGRSANSSGTRADIVATAASNTVLLETGSALSFGKADHGLHVAGLSDDDHTQYVLSAGRAGGQQIKGGTAAADNLSLYSSAHGTPTGYVAVFAPFQIQPDSASYTGSGAFWRNTANLLKFYSSAVERTLLAVPTTGLAQGDLPYWSGSNTAMLAAGTSGQFLKTLGAGANPVWASATGNAPSMQVFTASATSTYTTPAGVTAIMVEIVGAGGGGGGAAQAAVQSAGAGGGGGGSYCRKLIVSPAATYSYVVGAGGAAGAAGNNNGTAGTATTFSTLTAPGGSGGTGAAAGTAIAIVAGGTGGAVATGGDLNGGGQCGNLGFTLGAAIAFGGVGGVAGGGWGSGSNNRLTEAAGLSGIGHGAGGGGGCCLGTAAKAGAAGKDGAIYVTEYK